MVGMPDLADVTADDFEPLLDTDFEADGPDARVRLRLTDVQRLRERPGYRRPFSLLFEGPLEPCLPAQIVRLDHATGEIDLFLVPIVGPADRMTYEATFT